MCHESSGTALSETLGLGKGSVTLEDFFHLLIDLAEASRRHPAIAVRHQDMGRHVIQEEHDARVGRQVISPCVRRALGLPINADHAVQAPPADRNRGPDALGAAGHGMAIAHLSVFVLLTEFVQYMKIAIM